MLEVKIFHILDIFEASQIIPENVAVFVKEMYLQMLVPTVFQMNISIS